MNSASVMRQYSQFTRHATVCAVRQRAACCRMIRPSSTRPVPIAMAAYFIASIPLIIVFLFTMRFFVKGLSAGAIKG